MHKTVVLIALLLCSCSAINKKIGLQDDNIIEEAAEVLLDLKTGLKLDLTPSTQE